MKDVNQMDCETGMWIRKTRNPCFTYAMVLKSNSTASVKFLFFLAMADPYSCLVVLMTLSTICTYSPVMKVSELLGDTVCSISGIAS